MLRLCISCIQVPIIIIIIIVSFTTTFPSDNNYSLIKFMITSDIS